MSIPLDYKFDVRFDNSSMHASSMQKELATDISVGGYIDQSLYKDSNHQMPQFIP